MMVFGRGDVVIRLVASHGPKRCHKKERKEREE